MRDNDLIILDTVMKEISEKYQKSMNFFEENIKNKYDFLDFSTNILDNKIEIYYYNNQYIDNESYIIKYSFLKKDNESEWKFETKIYNEKISDLSIEEYDEIKKNISSIETLNLIMRTKEKRPSNIRRKVTRPDKFSLDFDKIKQELYLKYFSLKNKYIKINDISEVKYKISSILIEFSFVKDLYMKEQKVGEIVIRSYSNIINEREINFEIRYNSKVNSFSKSNQYLLRNNYFLSNVFPNFEKILVNDNDLIYNYYKKNILVFNKEKLNIEEIRECYYHTVANIQQQAKSIISKEGK